jgi:hypothetical protein
MGLFRKDRNFEILLGFMCFVPPCVSNKVPKGVLNGTPVRFHVHNIRSLIASPMLNKKFLILFPQFPFPSTYVPCLYVICFVNCAHVLPLVLKCPDVNPTSPHSYPIFFAQCLTLLVDGPDGKPVYSSRWPQCPAPTSAPSKKSRLTNLAQCNILIWFCA